MLINITFPIVSTKKMPGKVYIEKHLEDYLKSLAEEKAYIPGLIIGQVI